MSKSLYTINLIYLQKREFIINKVKHLLSYRWHMSGVECSSSVGIEKRGLITGWMKRRGVGF